MAELAELRRRFLEIQQQAARDQEEIGRLRARANENQVVVRPSSKLEKFKSTPASSTRVNDWIEEARHHIWKLALATAGDEAAEVCRYLDGAAKDDLRWRAPEDKDDAPKIFAILQSTFGNKRTTASLKQAFHARKQGEREDSEEFANALTLLLAELDQK